MYTSSILLIGAGRLGARYLQGLCAMDKPLSITVIDPSEISLSSARAMLALDQYAADHSVQFSTSLEDSPHYFDLSLIVTPAHCRSRLVNELLNRNKVKAMILEKVLAQNCVQIDQIEQCLSGNNQVWVNTPRRLMSWHKSIRSQLVSDESSPLQVRVSGGSWGLACNAIHFIDLVAWWTQSTVKFINPEGLDSWVSSKRAGFYEVFGTLKVFFTDGSELELHSCSENKHTQIVVTASDGKWVIDESVGKCSGPSGQELHGQLSFQSSLTPPLVAQILQQGNCDLPTLSQSATQHRPLLTALLKHWNHSRGCQDSIVPIT